MIKKIGFLFSFFFLFNVASADILVIYSDADENATTIDSPIDRRGVDEVFATIRNGDGTNVSHDATTAFVGAQASNTNNQFQKLSRYAFTLDTGIVPNGSALISAIVSLWGVSKDGGLGNPNFDIVTYSGPNNTVDQADYADFGASSFYNIAYASILTGFYNDFVLDVNGRAYTNIESITGFGIRTTWDTNNVFAGVWVGNTNGGATFYTADQAGTVNDPKITITYTPPLTPAKRITFMQ